MEETEVARVWRDSRAQTIYGGCSEVMRHIIAKEVLK
jgi:alkylation response protein AidB-like acyl-CoA dehydrogenase